MRFIKILAAVMALGLVFMTFGGYVLFDFRNHFWLASVICCFLLSLLIYVLVKQDDRIDRLEKRLEELEKTQKSENK